MSVHVLQAQSSEATCVIVCDFGTDVSGGRFLNQVWKAGLVLNAITSLGFRCGAGHAVQGPRASGAQM